MRFLLPIFLIGVAIGGFILITKPIYSEIEALQKEGEAYEQALQNSANLQKERDRLTTKLNSFTPEDLAKLEKMLPNTVDNIKLILEIQEQASNQGIVVRNVQFEPKQFIEEEKPTTSTTSGVNQNSVSAQTAANSPSYPLIPLTYGIPSKSNILIRSSTCCLLIVNDRFFSVSISVCIFFSSS